MLRYRHLGLAGSLIYKDICSICRLHTDDPRCSHKVKDLCINFYGVDLTNKRADVTLRRLGGPEVKLSVTLNGLRRPFAGRHNTTIHNNALRKLLNKVRLVWP